MSSSTKLPRLGIGPMSREIIDIACRYSLIKNQPLMIIASRNQVDMEGGYVCSTADMVKQIKNSGSPNIMICRDHCGPYFKDSDHTLSINDAVRRSIETIEEDIRCGFDLIHIDTSRVEDQGPITKDLIEHAIGLDPHIMLEFGSEENIGAPCSIDRMTKDLALIKPYMDNMVFMVAQTGSLVKDRQVGTFDIAAVRRIADLLHRHGLLLKEHNADYLSERDMIERREAGIDSMNIAPQLGTVQSRLLMEHCIKAGASKEWDDLCQDVYVGGRWKRWTSSTNVTTDEIGIIAGHYHQNSPSYKKAVSMIDLDDFLVDLEERITVIFDRYIGGG